MKLGATRGIPRVPKKSPNTGSEPRPDANSIMNGNLEERKMTMRGLTRKKQREDMSHARLDILFLLLFPLFFLIFNVIYWASFLYGMILLPVLLPVQGYFGCLWDCEIQYDCKLSAIYVQNFQSYLFGNLISTQSSPVLVWLYFWYRSPLSVYEILEYNMIVNCLPFMVDFCNIELTNLQSCCILQPHKYS